MKLSLLHQPATSASTSPYRLVDQWQHEVPWANAFLDAQRIRQLSLRSLRAYGYDLLHFARWWLPRHPSRTVQEIDESALLDYVRDQLNEDPQPTPQTINHRLGMLRSLYRFHSGRPLTAGSHGFQRPYLTQSPMGYGRPRRMMATGLRLKQPHRVIVPLSADEVAKFWRSFRTFRDLALVALMLLNGLRSQETLDLQLEDLQLAEAQLRVLGKGNKPRPLPLPGETIQVIQNYILGSDLNIQHGGADLRVSHQLLECGQGDSRPHHIGSKGVSKPVGIGLQNLAAYAMMAKQGAESGQGHGYLHLERPVTNSRALFVSLKGLKRGLWREYARAVGNRTRLSVPQDL
jgi:integrase